MTIFTNLDLAETQREAMRKLAGTHAVYFGHPEKTPAGDEEVFMQAQVVFGSCPPEWLSRSEHLRWVQLDSVGFDRYLHLDWSGQLKHVVCTNLHGFFAEAVAETALAGILALYRGIDRLVLLGKDRDWKKLELRPQLRLLTGAHVLLVGYGAINRRLETLLEPFGCRVTRYIRSSTLEELDRALPEADIICAAVPDTPLTRDLFDRQRLARLKRGAIFVNVGRGSLVDEAALAEELQSHRLGGAVIDVTREEPLPPDHPLWRCPRTLLTQHTSGGFETETDGKIEFFKRNLERYLRNQPLESVVDFKRGY